MTSKSYGSSTLTARSCFIPWLTPLIILIKVSIPSQKGLFSTFGAIDMDNIIPSSLDGSLIANVVLILVNLTLKVRDMTLPIHYGSCLLLIFAEVTSRVLTMHQTRDGFDKVDNGVSSIRNGNHGSFVLTASVSQANYLAQWESSLVGLHGLAVCLRSVGYESIEHWD